MTDDEIRLWLTAEDLGDAAVAIYEPGSRVIVDYIDAETVRALCAAALEARAERDQACRDAVEARNLDWERPHVAVKYAALSARLDSYENPSDGSETAPVGEAK